MLPAFLDRHFPQGLDLYWSKVSSYFSLRSKPKGTGQTSSNKPVSPPGGGSIGSKTVLNQYAELDPSIEMSSTGEDLEHRGADSYYEITVGGGSQDRDVESLRPGRIMKTVDLQQT